MRPRHDCALVFMAKWPEPGRAKTRLSPPLSTDDAADLARCFLLDTLEEAGRAAADHWLAFAPLSAERAFHALVGPDVGLIPAETTSLGGALRAGQRAALAAGYRRVALVGSDLPHLPAARYAEAFAALDDADVALGPCADGGYYALAAERATPSLFEGVAWSTAAVYAQTVERAVAAGLRVRTLAACDDVDTAADLPALAAALDGAPRGRRTRALLRRLRLPAPAGAAVG